MGVSDSFPKFPLFGGDKSAVKPMTASKKHPQNRISGSVQEKPINSSCRTASSSFSCTHLPTTHTHTLHQNGLHCLHLHRLRRGPQGVQGPGTCFPQSTRVPRRPFRCPSGFAICPNILRKPIAFSAGSAPYLTSRPPHSSSFRPSLCPRSSRPTSTPSSAPTPAVVSPPSSPSAPRRTPSVRSSTAAGRCSV